MRLILCLLCCVPFLGARAVPDRPGLQEGSLQPRGAPVEEGAPRFQLLAPEDSGVDFPLPLSRTHPLKYIYHSGYASPGLAAGDLNGDGLPDLFIAGSAYPDRLYIQTAPFVFEDRSEAAGIRGSAWGAGVAMADLDGDGDLDVYVCNYDAPNELWINDGKGRFEERARAFGLDLVDGSFQPAFADYDQDGDLDLYIVTYRLYYPTGRPARIRSLLDGKGGAKPAPEFERYFALTPQPGTPPAAWKFHTTGRPDYLYRNNGDGSFSDVTREAGLQADTRGYGNSALWWDYDGDGWLDLLVANDFTDADWLYRNQGDGTFKEVIREATPQTSYYSMGSCSADFNNDGRMDALVADMAATTHFVSKINMGDMRGQAEFLDSCEPRQFMRNALYLGTGTRQLQEGGYLAGVAKSNWSWATQAGDFDNDGREDLYITNGMVRDFMNSDFVDFDIMQVTNRTAWSLFEDQPKREERNMAFRNQGDLAFEEAGRSWGLDQLGLSYAALQADLDLDGDLDLVVANVDDRIMLLRNQTRDAGGLLLRLDAGEKNRFGIGARVDLWSGGLRQTRQLLPSQGFLSCNAPLLHFGLGSATRIDRLVVTWPGGARQAYTGLEPGRLLTITRLPEPEPVPEPAPSEALFKPSDTLRWVRHVETPFDDYAQQSLLPHKLSQFGPGMAWADVNGDGHEDLYLCGAAGQAGELHLSRGDGSFRWTSIPAAHAFSAEEEMSALFFDADGDRDLDLYVVTGSVEHPVGDAAYQDRLYLNNSEGGFAPAPEGSLPALHDSGSLACAADFDRDGDLDLFVGSRSVPGQYPESPISRLLRNNGGRFEDVTALLAPGLRKPGMVTGGLWSDANGDGWIDLLVSTDWGPVRLFENRQGRMKEVTEEAGLAERLGWWNGIAGRDLDHDGDIDYLVSNLGLNTKYKAGPEQPVHLFYHDFDGTGQKKIVEAFYENGKLLPMRGRSCSSLRMPFIAKKFETYRAFALAGLPEIYTGSSLDEALKLSVNTLETGLLINDGKGRFEWKPLPRVAQIAPSYGCVLSDLDADGHCDAALAQNFFHPQRETPRMGGGLGQVLLGTAAGELNALPPSESGLIAPVDGTALSITDLNADGWPDLVLAANNERLQVFESRGLSDRHPLWIQLEGPDGNPQAVGAKLTLRGKGIPVQVAEVQAGGGYLSQSGSALLFGLGTTKPALRADIRWPDGSESSHENPAPSTRWTIRQPAP